MIPQPQRRVVAVPANQTYEQNLQEYATLLISHGLNVQKGQVVNIAAEACQRDFVLDCVRAAYGRGASFVNVDLIDMRYLKERIVSNSEEDLKYVPKFVATKYDEIIDREGANLKLVGFEDPDILSDLDPKKVNIQRLHQHLAVKRFYDEGIGKSKVHWTVAAAATPAWAERVFPGVDPAEAQAKLWNEIFRLSRVGSGTSLSKWKEHNALLQKRAKNLTQMKIKELHFKGPGTDLIVGLSPKAVFCGGSSPGPRGVEYEPNIPTEECFTTPDYTKTEGKVRTTRPFLVSGKMVKGLELEFVSGRITKFSASEGEDTFREYINSDEGGSRLGEVALVGIDSPVFQSGLLYHEILFDENAACHIAIGSAYKFCLEGGDSLSKEDLQALGCNESSVHTDMMISSEAVDVEARLYNGESRVLIRKGAWD